MVPGSSASGRAGHRTLATLGRVEHPEELPRTCAWCGRQETDLARSLTWTTAVENGRVRTFCDACSREHLRAMEGKLDSEHW